ncbi:MAG: 4-hydroxy-tetrahydrodipicolinate reductase [Gemmatimonadota bacterium]
MRIAVVGNGRMGRAIAERAREAGDEIACILDSKTNPGGSGITAETMRGAEVAFEFTTPDAVVPNLGRLSELRVPTVVGTTGWHDRLPEVRRMVEEHRSALVYAANFAPGVHLFLRLAREAGRLFAAHADFDAHILETHHRGKRDAPSGTARLLRDAARDGDPAREVPITSVRAGHVPGEHRLVYDAADETIELVHSVRHRHVFAAGALLAGRWIAGRRGFYDFTQVLFGSPDH